MKVFAQGYQAGKDGVDIEAIKQAIEEVYNDNKAYGLAYASGYTSGRDDLDMNAAIERFLEGLEK